MTVTPPEAPEPLTPPEEASLPKPRGGRDADGVPEDALTRYAVYDNRELRYLDGTHPTAAAAAKATPKGAPGQYAVRRV